MEQPRRGWSWVKKGSALKPNGKKYQVSSDIDTDLVEMGLKDGGRQELEDSQCGQFSGDLRDGW